MNLVLGIDGGGSRTRAWIAQVDGTIISRGEAGAANVHQLGVDASRRAIATAARNAWQTAALPGGRPCAFSAVFAGVAGAGAREDQRALASALVAEFGLMPHTCAVEHDLRVALAGALVGKPGVVVVAGTGSACYGRKQDGRSWKAGGWGCTLDDGGSGHWLGMQALRAVVRVADGRLGPTPLVVEVMHALQLGTPRQLIDGLRDGSVAREVIVALAPKVIECAKNGDATALAVLEAGASELASMAAAVSRGLGISGADLRVVGAGGLLENHAIYRDRVKSALARDLPGSTFLEAVAPPAAGAALLALELAGVKVDDAIAARVCAPES